jgi:hypothetical protein
VKYMKLYGSSPRTEHGKVNRLRRRIERYRRALRRCRQRVKQEQRLRAADTKGGLFLNEGTRRLSGLGARVR